MTIINPIELFKDLGIPVGYYVNPRPGKVPFMVYYGTGTNNFKADDQVYTSNQHWNLELYVCKKDVALEQKIEKILNENEIIWEKGREVYIFTDRTFLIPYYI
ncbi:MAG: hypothetical protein Q4P25_04210 [Tissierellia bacterium]|nr:hypothetical protein [Tissierellia bacterium]